jgi:phenylacetate-CoA ligase
MYGAEVMDHPGATEIGPWGFGAKDGKALHVIESEFIAEFIPAAGRSHEDEGIFELVMTSLGRVGAPVLRYRTGDLVRPVQTGNPSCQFVRLEGGVLGRVDDMLVVRGVNVFPSSIDAILRSFSNVSDYRLTVTKTNALDELVLEFERANSIATETELSVLANAISEKLSVQLNLRFQVTEVMQGTLPRYEGKAKRIFDRRG